MRNLVLSALDVSSLDVLNGIDANVDAGASTTQGITATAIDVDRDVIFAAAFDHIRDEATIWRTSRENNGSGISGDLTFIGMFSTPKSDVISLKVLAEFSQLVLIVRGGDIVSWDLDDSGNAVGEAEVQGSIDAGIVTAEWSPDDSYLTLITGEGNLIIMTSTFDVLSEAPLETSDFGEDTPINVGWGSKETQFHGSIGRAHLKESAPIGSSEDGTNDDGLPRISWRGDGTYFVVSSLSSRVQPSNNATTASQPSRQRIFRVYTHDGRLQSTSETLSGLEASVAWKPSGGLIAGTQKEVRSGPHDSRQNGKHEVVFFERNGLKHGEFGLRRRGGEYKIKFLAWSSDSAVLAVWIEQLEGDVVQLWIIGNYHWYLKQEIRAPGPSGKFTAVAWHPEITILLVLTTANQVIQRTYAWETCAGADDTGCVGVVDGDNVLLTLFRTQNVPPPMSSHQLSIVSACHSKTESQPTPSFSRPPAQVALSHSHDLLGAIWEQGNVAIWDLHTRLSQSRGKPMEPVVLWSGDLSSGEGWISRQIVLSARKEQVAVAILGSSGDEGDKVIIFEVPLAPSEAPLQPKHAGVMVPGRNGRLVSCGGDDLFAWQAPGGDVFAVSQTNDPTSLLCAFPEFCFWFTRVDVRGLLLFIGLSISGKLYAACSDANTQVLATNVNSFTVASGFVIYTTTAHEAYFAPVEKIASMLLVPANEPDLSADGPSNPSNAEVGNWEKRRVERGSRIVTAVPSTTSLVLQMPRGNLETINPRPMVMKILESDLDAGNWRKAFLACRKHRVDLSVIVEHNKDAFMSNVAAFVEQIDDVDYVNLFLTSVGRSQLPSGDIATVCDALRLELERKDISKYVNSILTAYVVKSPPDHESGLALLLRLRESQPELVEDAVKYIIFLVDADRLFDTALGMYDFSLVLMVAQHAQKDPREYLPFLRELRALRALSKFYQRFRIDDHLRRYSKALTNLNLAGEEHFQEAIAYVERHQLYDEALKIWKGTDNYENVLKLYGEWLFERRDFRQAALIFIEASDVRKAIVAHERALEWQELFELSAKENMPDEEIKETAYRIAEELFAKKRFSESARVLFDYAKDTRQGVISLVHGNEFSEARRAITFYSVPELLDEIVLPGALESCNQILEDISEMKDQLRKQVSRLAELRIKKLEEPDAFYGTEDTNLHNVDVMTDVSMAPTAFTRYTVAPSAVSSKASKKSSKTKRKMERKIGSGRKGTVDEEEYLLRSLTKLVDKCSTTKGEITRLTPHLLHLSQEHRSEGIFLQAEFNNFEGELRAAVDDVWKRPGETEESATTDTWAGRMLEKEKERLIDPLERVPKPKLTDEGWTLKLLQINKEPASGSG
ncbi:pol II transcription elongation factor [Hygrophoropsis aurantiaca]|uniref:Pol II transcription elongation factor n=1 Tax=Hygrophoropsis aurantiaca TaxID=72124 RepID=A0ACB8AAB0_9AGAM|nr:pol II transcription elongation factor [Hygrophoropsis aurantiaca]